MDGLTSGRMIHYVMPNGEHRPGVITNVWNDRGLINASVFTDYTNDVPYKKDEEELFRNNGVDPNQAAHGHIWKTSISYSEEPKVNTWHWIEKA